MKLNKSEDKVLSIIDGKLNYHVLLINKGLGIRYTKRSKKAIQSLKEKGLIYKDSENMLRRVNVSNQKNVA